MRLPAKNGREERQAYIRSQIDYARFLVIRLEFGCECQAGESEKGALKRLCQLEGSDCGGRDRRPSWHWRALSILNRMLSFNWTDVWAPTPSSTFGIIHLRHNQSTKFCD